MARTDGKAENQHYVPQFLLRNFSFVKRERKLRSEESYIHSFDKHTDKIFTPNIKGIASEVGFYDFYMGEEDSSLEPALSELESNTQSAIKKIIEHENLHTLTPEDRAWISLFVSVQYLRVKKQREVLRQFNHDMAERIRKMGFDPDEVDGFEKLDEEKIKAKTLQSFVTDSPIIAQLIADKICLLFKSDHDNPLYISDNPVVMHNDEDFGPYGNIGFAVPGIQIYLPISSNLCLAFWCPTFEKKFHDAWLEFERLEQNARATMLLNPKADRNKLQEIIKKCELEKEKPKNFSKNASNGTPIRLIPETVMALNSYQVKWSHRFVMCKKDDFSLVRRMISDNDAFREGIKITVD